MKRVVLRIINSVVRVVLRVCPVERILDLENHIRLAYRLLLRRRPDSNGFRDCKEHIEAQGLHRAFAFEVLAGSAEYKKVQDPLAYVRCQLVQRMPAADVIVDFGGSTKHMNEGALHAMGYRSKWQRMIIVDLPPEKRDRQWRPERHESTIVEAPNGPVEYVYGSMSDPDVISESGFADLVWSGNSIEHISETEADVFLAIANRVLKPDGLLCLDTPNRRITEIQHPASYTNADHKVEYTHRQLSAKLVRQGFVIEEALGVLDCRSIVDGTPFSIDALAKCPEFTTEVENGYFLFYRCRKRESG